MRDRSDLRHIGREWLPNRYRRTTLLDPNIPTPRTQWNHRRDSIQIVKRASQLYLGHHSIAAGTECTQLPGFQRSGYPINFSLQVSRILESRSDCSLIAHEAIVRGPSSAGEVELHTLVVSPQVE